MTSTLIRNGSVIDGSGGQAFPGHVLLEDGRIAAILRGDEIPEADAVIDAAGKAVAPGFIDMHSHADWLLPTSVQNQLLARLLEQGVTTVVGGNCGISPAPVRAQGIPALERLALIAIEEALPYDWSTMEEYLERVDSSAPAVNVAELVGHAAIRYACADTRRGAMKPDELRACLAAARQSLDQGACGLSLGLGYDPGMYSPLEELSAFAAVAAAADKPLTVHLKALSRISPCYPITSLGAHNVRALGEALDIARATGVRLQLSHFLFVGRRSWATAPECIALVEEARSQGVDVMIDAFPFTCGNTTINVVMPYWYLANLRTTSKSTRARARLRLELEVCFRLLGFGLKNFRLMNAGVPGWEEMCGLTVPEIARQRGLSPFAAFLEISEQTRGAAVMLFDTYSGDSGDERALEAVLGRDYCLFESDAVLRSGGFPNPAALGTFPRVLGRMVRERRLVDLEGAVRRMTAASAERFGLTDRGRLEQGRAADVVIFDADEIADSTPTGGQPAARPKGIEHVFVNGVHAVEGGRAKAAPGAGRVLRT